MRVYKRGKYYWMQFRGQRFSLHVTDRKAAEVAAREAQRRAVDPTYCPPNEAATLGQALSSFVERQRERGRADGTLGMYDLHVRHLARVLGEHRPLATIEAAEVDGYLSTRHAEGASRSTQWKELCTLRGALKLARRQKLYPHAVADVMPIGFEYASEPGTRHLLLPDVHKLLAKLPERRAAVVAFIVATAADYPSNVERVQPGDIDLKRGFVRVRGSKTAHRDRVVPILPLFRPLAELAARSMPFEPWGNVGRDLAVACRRAGVQAVTPRDLRRSHARILRAAGVEPSLIASMLGHRDGRMVERVYGRIQPDELGALIGQRIAGPARAKRTRSRKTGTKTVRRSARGGRKSA